MNQSFNKMISKSRIKFWVPQCYMCWIIFHLHWKMKLDLFYQLLYVHLQNWTQNVKIWTRNFFHNSNHIFSIYLWRLKKLVKMKKSLLLMVIVSNMQSKRHLSLFRVLGFHLFSLTFKTLKGFLRVLFFQRVPQIQETTVYKPNS